MMHLAYYAPLKEPDHPVPSGDRTMSRAVLAALEHAGHKVTQTSTLRLYDKLGERDVQDALFAAAEAEVARILALDAAQDWQAWVTYHSYYKAPDLVGPAVCKALNLPYFQIEATRAKKRLKGPWARFAEAAEAACDLAHTIFYFTDRDAEALRRDAPEGQKLIHLPPFLAQESLPDDLPHSQNILTVGMMRPGDKLASYALVSECLAWLPDTDWHLRIAGDGPARVDVERMFTRFGDRVSFLGEIAPAEMPDIYASASVFLWPGVNEAFGMVYLEAQAAGLTVVAQDRPGVRDVVHTPLVAVEEGAAGLALRLGQILQDPGQLAVERAAAREAMIKKHLLPHAAQVLNAALRDLS